MTFTIKDLENEICKLSEIKKELDTVVKTILHILHILRCRLTVTDQKKFEIYECFLAGNLLQVLQLLTSVTDLSNLSYFSVITGSGESKSDATKLKINGEYEKKISDAIDKNLKKTMSLDKRSSYLTPDKRFIATNQYIPGKNKNGKEIKKIAILVDCSGSMSTSKIQNTVNNCITTLNEKCSAFKNYKTEIHFFRFNTKLNIKDRYLGIVNSTNQIQELSFDGAEDFETTAKQVRKYCGNVSLCIILSDYQYSKEDLEYLKKITKMYKTLKLDVNKDF